MVREDLIPGADAGMTRPALPVKGRPGRPSGMDGSPPDAQDTILFGPVRQEAPRLPDPKIRPLAFTLEGRRKNRAGCGTRQVSTRVLKPANCTRGIARILRLEEENDGFG